MKIPADWDEVAYLAHNPDVAGAVKKKKFNSGWQHYANYGKQEGRSAKWLTTADSPTTRECLDPWTYLEITPSHGLKPCCKYAPIEQWEPNGTPIEALRNSQAFRELRQTLLSGELLPICQSCHIRPWVPVKQLQHLLESESHRGDEAKLLPWPLRQLRLEITTRCNLRCVYCPVSQASYSGQDMSVEAFGDVLTMVESLPRDIDILVNGHGETTYHPDWLDLCGNLTLKGFRPSIITNLARPLDDKEAECLARFKGIQISLDTVDHELLANLRRRVSIFTIVGNMEKIRETARRLRTRSPSFSLSCGVFDANFEGLEGVAAFAIEHDIHCVTFWNLVKYSDIPDALNVNSVESLERDRMRDAVICLDRALAMLKEAGIATEVAGGFLNEWRNRISPSGASKYG